MIGDVLKAKLPLLKEASIRRNDANAFWKVIRDIAREEIIALSPSSVDSDLLISLYYRIIKEHLDTIPPFFQEKLASNGQERFRVIVRNVLSSNAFHPEGLAQLEGIYAKKEINPKRKGSRIVFQGGKEHVDTK